MVSLLQGFCGASLMLGILTCHANEVSEQVIDLSDQINTTVKQQCIAYLGVGMRALGVAGAAAHQLPYANGLLLTHIAPDSSAEQAGLIVGDILLQFEDQILFSELQLQALMYHYTPGQEVSLLLQRNGESKEVTVILGQKPVTQHQITTNDVRSMFEQFFWEDPFELHAEIFPGFDVEAMKERMLNHSFPPDLTESSIYTAHLQNNTHKVNIRMTGQKCSLTVTQLDTQDVVYEGVYPENEQAWALIPPELRKWIEDAVPETVTQ